MSALQYWQKCSKADMPKAGVKLLRLLATSYSFTVERRTGSTSSRILPLQPPTTFSTSISLIALVFPLRPGNISPALKTHLLHKARNWHGILSPHTVHRACYYLGEMEVRTLLSCFQVNQTPQNSWTLTF